MPLSLAVSTWPSCSVAVITFLNFSLTMMRSFLLWPMFSLSVPSFSSLRAWLPCRMVSCALLDARALVDILILGCITLWLYRFHSALHMVWTGIFKGFGLVLLLVFSCKFNPVLNVGWPLTHRFLSRVACIEYWFIVKSDWHQAVKEAESRNASF